MDALLTPRLRIVPLSLEHAEAMLDGATPTDANWAPGYPADSTLVAAAIVVTAAAEGTDLGPWSMYQAVSRADDRVIGGLGYDALPCGGRVPIGFSETEFAREQNAMPEALRALIALGKERADVTITADTALTNTRAAEVLAAAGMRVVCTDAGLQYFEI